MSKAKETIKEFREKLFEAKKQETVEKAQQTLEKTLENEVYTVVQDPNVKGRAFLIVKIQFDLKTGKAAVVGQCSFSDKAAGLTMIMDQENRKYLFNKNNRSKK